MKKFIITLLTVLTVLTSLTGCRSVSASNPEMTKGEYIMLFVDEFNLNPSNPTVISIDYDKESKYYDAALIMVNMGYMDKDDDFGELEKAVTKEYVAETCAKISITTVNYADVVLKDEKDLKNPDACKAAVALGIVEIQNGYLDAYDKMTYQQCKSAIDKVIENNASISFDESQQENEIVYKDEVIDASEELNGGVTYIDSTDPDYEKIMQNMVVDLSVIETSSTKNGQYEKLSVGTNNKPLFNMEGITVTPAEKASVGDYILISLPYDAIKKYNLAIGSSFVWGKDNSAEVVIDEEVKPFFGKIVGMDTTTSKSTVYLTIYVADEYDVIDLEATKLNGTTVTLNGLNIPEKKLADDKISVKAENGKIIVTYKDKITEKGKKVEGMSESQITSDYSVTFELSNIKLTYDGLAQITSNHPNGNSFVRLDYTVTNKFNLSTSMHLNADNNNDASLWNRIANTSFTSSGEKSKEFILVDQEIVVPISVKNIYIPIKLAFTIDVTGKLTYTNVTDYSKGFMNKNGQLVTIDYAKKEQNELNAYGEIDTRLTLTVGVKLFKWGGVWVNVKPTIGLLLTCTIDIYEVLDDAKFEKQSVISAFHPAFISDAMASSTKVKSCLNVTATLYWELDIATKGTYIGDALRLIPDMKDWMSNNLPLGGRSKGVIFTRAMHIEDGVLVDECTRKDKDEPIEEDGDANNICINTYVVIVDRNDTENLTITSIPVSEDTMALMGGITVSSADGNIAAANIDGNTIQIIGIGIGSTQVKIESANKRFIQYVAVTVNPLDSDKPSTQN